MAIRFVVGVVFLLMTSTFTRAQAVAVLAQVKDKAGRQYNATWSKFGTGQFGIFYNSHTKKLYLVDPDARLPVAVENLPPETRQGIRWAAKDAGVGGNLEVHLRRRYNAKRPLLIPFHYGKGYDAVANAWVVLPLSSVAPADRQAFIDAGVEWNRQWTLVLLEQEKIAASRDAEVAARDAESAARDAEYAAQEAAAASRHNAFWMTVLAGEVWTMRHSR
jgi:hypothetical protein